MTNPSRLDCPSPRHPRRPDAPSLLSGTDERDGVASLVLGITAVILGIVLFPLGIVCGILAIVFGFFGKGNAAPTGAGRGMAIAGIVLGIVGVVLGLLWIVFILAVADGHRINISPRPVG